MMCEVTIYNMCKYCHRGVAWHIVTEEWRSSEAGAPFVAIFGVPIEAVLYTNIIFPSFSHVNFQSRDCEPLGRERLSFVIPREDVGRMFSFTRETHILFE